MNKAIGVVFIITTWIVALNANAVKASEDCKTCCELPNNFENGKLRTVARKTRGLRIVPAGSVLQFKCDDQYLLTGAKRVTCKEGVWTPQLPVCTATTLGNAGMCELPRDFANGKLRTVKKETRGLPIVPEGSVLQFKCDDEYELMGASRVTCQQGIWFPSLPICIATTLENAGTCELPRDFANGKLRTEKKETRGLPIVPEGSVLQFKCDDEYELMGASRVTCQQDIWFPPLPICIAKRNAISTDENECDSCCKMPTNFNNGKVAVNSNIPGSSVVPEYSVLHILCNVGYTIRTVNKSLCIEGEWSPKIPSCVSISCPPPPPLENGRVISEFDDDDEFPPGTRIYYECNEHYDLVKESSLFCVEINRESTWIGELPQCKEKVKCEDPGEFFNGKRQGPCCNVGDIVNYTCIKDYDIVGSSAILCTQAGTWNDTRTICQPKVFCAVPDVLPNGKIKGKNRGGFYLPDDEIMIICDQGYTVGNESDYLYCELNGKWDAEIPECKSTVNCDVPELPENGYILELLQDKNRTDFPYDFEINFVCNSGYRLIGDSWLSCGEYGWKNKIPKCEEILCPYPGKPDNGWIHGSDYQIGNVTLFGCYSGYSLLGSSKRECLENGRWNGELARCDSGDNYCPNPGSPVGGRKYGNSYDLGAKVTFECDRGRILIGSANRTCQKDKRWSGEEARCFGEHDFDNKRSVGNKLKSILSTEAMSQEVKVDNFKTILQKVNDSEGLDLRGRAIDLNFPGRLIFIFIFDVSGSIGETSFKRSIEFAKAMVKTAKVTEDGIRVGAITFSNKAEKEFYPMDYKTTEQVLEALDKIEHKKGGTAATSALILLQDMMPLITRILGSKSKFITFIITDGKANMAGDPASDAEILKKRGVEIYCIGITGDRKMQTLYEIASSKNDHVFILDGYESMNWLVQDIVNNTIDYSKCGVRRPAVVENQNEDNRGRAIGGKIVVKPWPWMVVVFTVNPRDKDTTQPLSVCGASIIDRKWILTAAHCMHEKKNNRVVWKTKDDIIIHFGLTNLRNDTYIQKRVMIRYIVHELYDPKTIDNDIALIEIERPLLYNEFVRPVCLPPYNDDLHEVPKFYRANELAEVVGWGYDRPLKESELAEAHHIQVAKSVSLPLQDRETCGESLKNRPKNNIFTDQMICAGGNGKDACKGDSGGPLMQELTDELNEEHWTQIGIVSWGNGCGQPGVYGFYTKVSMFTNWIKDTIKNE